MRQGISEDVYSEDVEVGMEIEVEMEMEVGMEIEMKMASGLSCSSLNDFEQNRDAGQETRKEQSIH